MSKEAIEYKSSHKDINYKKFSLAELNNLPLIMEFTILKFQRHLF